MTQHVFSSVAKASAGTCPPSSSRQGDVRVSDDGKISNHGYTACDTSLEPDIAPIDNIFHPPLTPRAGAAPARWTPHFSESCIRGRLSVGGHCIGHHVVLYPFSEQNRSSRRSPITRRAYTGLRPFIGWVQDWSKYLIIIYSRKY